MFRRRNDERDTLQTILQVIGIIVTIGAAVYVLYRLFRKYFNISFDCGCECDECEDADDCDFCDCDSDLGRDDEEDSTVSDNE
jgi:hypothetical protein